MIRWLDHKAPTDIQLNAIRLRCTINENGCWLWSGVPHYSGYAHIWYAKKSRIGHTLTYELKNGTIPLGHELHHRSTCPKHCINPEHVIPLTHKEHSIAHTDPHFYPCGHPRTSTNTHTSKGKTCCRECNLAHRKRYDNIKRERRDAY